MNQWNSVIIFQSFRISLDKLLKKGESAWKSTKDTAASVADKTATAVAGAAETTKQTTTSVIDSSSKLAKNTADKTSDLAHKAWDGSKNVATAAAEKTTTAAGHAWEGIQYPSIYNIYQISFYTDLHRTEGLALAQQLLLISSSFPFSFLKQFHFCIYGKWFINLVDLVCVKC